MFRHCLKPDRISFGKVDALQTQVEEWARVQVGPEPIDQKIMAQLKSGPPDLEQCPFKRMRREVVRRF